MISKPILLSVFWSFLWTVNAWAAERIKVITTLPDFAWMAQEIGGEFVEAKALLRGTENPHYVDAVPDFIRLVADAKIVCMAGMDLEVGYMPAVLSKSGNAAVQPGGSGYCELGRSVTALDKPTGRIDRSMGDVHPAGNPHFFLSPRSLAEGSQELVKTLVRVDPAHAVHYEKAGAAFRTKMENLSKEIKAIPRRAAGQTPAFGISQGICLFSRGIWSTVLWQPGRKTRHASIGGTSGHFGVGGESCRREAGAGC
jgi:zinc/manganese transport system substrate-binding protein